MLINPNNYDTILGSEREVDFLLPKTRTQSRLEKFNHFSLTAEMRPFYLAKEMKLCLDCGKKLKDYRSIRCRSCSKKKLFQNREKTPNWKGGKPKCIVCKKILKSYTSSKCSKCAKLGITFSDERRNKIKQSLQRTIKERGSWGFQNGHLPWNTGKKRPKMSGDKHPNWKGGDLEKNCKECGKVFYSKHSYINRGYFCTRKCFIKWKIKNSPKKEKHYNWKGGITPEINKRTSSLKWKTIRNMVYERDVWKCQICNKHCDKDIQCHHIIPYRISYNDDFKNLVTLCKACHIKEERNYPNGKFTQDHLLVLQKRI